LETDRGDRLTDRRVQHPAGIDDGRLAGRPVRGPDDDVSDRLRPSRQVDPRLIPKVLVEAVHDDTRDEKEGEGGNADEAEGQAGLEGARNDPPEAG